MYAVIYIVYIVLSIAECGRKERSPRVGAMFCSSVENERAGAGRDGQTCLAKPNSQARTNGDREEKKQTPVQLATSRTGKPYPG